MSDNATTPTATFRPTQYQVSIFPEDDINASTFTLTVAWRGRDRWAVLNGGFCLSRSGGWDYERVTSEREDEWLDAHRFDLDEARRLAEQHAPDVMINGRTAAEVLAWSHNGPEDVDDYWAPEPMSKSAAEFMARQSGASS